MEVYDEASDVVVYDVEKHEIVTASNIFSKDAFETFPTFSPDGKTLYFCTAEARPIPQEYSEVKYNLCSVSFDPVTRAIGAQVDTLYNAKSGGMSASFRAFRLTDVTFCIHYPVMETFRSGIKMLIYIWRTFRQA